MKKRIYEPNKAYLWKGSWQGVWSKVKKAKGKPVWITLELPTSEDPALSCYGVVWLSRRAKELGYLEMEARLGDDNLIYLSGLVNQNTGDEYGFGVEPDDYLHGVVDHNGNIVEPFHFF